MTTTYNLPDLQPLTMGQLLDRALRIYRNNFLTFIGIIAVTQIPTLLFTIVSVVIGNNAGSVDPLDVPAGDPFAALTDQIVGLGLLGIVVGIVGLILTQIANAAVTRAVADKYLGAEIGILESFGRIQNDWWVLLGAVFVASIFSIALVLWWIIVPCIGWFTGAGMIFFFSSVILPLLAPIIVLEKQSSSKSIYRAWDLSRRRFWWVMGFALLIAVFGMLILGGPTLLLTFGATSFIGAGTNSTLALILQNVVQSLINIIYLPLPLICFTLAYFDLRVRTEGIDLALQSVSAVESSGTVDQLLKKAPPPENWSPTRDEMWKFLTITGIFVGLYVGLIAVFIAIASIASF